MKNFDWEKLRENFKKGVDERRKNREPRSEIKDKEKKRVMRKKKKQKFFKGGKLKKVQSKHRRNASEACIPSNRMKRRDSEIERNLSKIRGNKEKTKQLKFKFKSFQKSLSKIDSFLKRGSTQRSLGGKSAKNKQSERNLSFGRFKFLSQWKLKTEGSQPEISIGRIGFFEEGKKVISEANESGGKDYVKIKHFFEGKDGLMKKKAQTGILNKSKKRPEWMKKNSYFSKKLFSAGRNIEKSMERVKKGTLGEDSSHLFQNKQIFGTLNNFFNKRRNKKEKERNTEGYERLEKYGSSPLIKNIENSQKQNLREIKKIFEKMSEGKKTHRKVFSSARLKPEQKIMEHSPNKKESIRSFKSQPKSSKAHIFKSLEFRSELIKSKDLEKKTKPIPNSHQRYMSMNLPKPDVMSSFITNPSTNLTQNKKLGIKSPKLSKQKTGPVYSYSVNSYKNFDNLIDEDRVSIYFNRIPLQQHMIGKIVKKIEFTNFSFFGLYEGFNGNFCANFFKEQLHKALSLKLESQRVYEAIKEAVSDVQKEYFKACEQVGVSDLTSTSASIFFTLGNLGVYSRQNGLFCNHW
jgi:hypothetical protein